MKLKQKKRKGRKTQMLRRFFDFVVRRAKARAIRALEKAKEREWKEVSYGDLHDTPNLAFYSGKAQANCEQLDKIIEILRDGNGTLADEWCNIIAKAILRIPQEIIPSYLKNF